jgi:dihydrofolate reductase
MELTVTMFVSLDGVMEIPGGQGGSAGEGLDLAGWLVPYGDGEMARMFTDWFERADAFLLGRTTYEIFAANWPHVTDPANAIAARLNSQPKYVVSTTLDTPEWSNSTVIAGDIATEVASLKHQPGREIQVHGSGQLVRTLIDHNLVDEYRLFTYPALLGRGERLFQEGNAASLRLIHASATSTGVTVSAYRSAGVPLYHIDSA